MCRPFGAEPLATHLLISSRANPAVDTGYTVCPDCPAALRGALMALSSHSIRRNLSYALTLGMAAALLASLGCTRRFYRLIK